MTYCVGVMLDSGLIFASDSRTHAGVDNFASFCKLSVFERPDDRVIVLLSSGNLAGTQAVISILQQRVRKDVEQNLWRAETMFDAALMVSDAMREVDRRDGQHLTEDDVGFNASFILGGQIKGEPPRLFRIYAAGNFFEAGEQPPYLQAGEMKYGKSIIVWIGRILIARGCDAADVPISTAFGPSSLLQFTVRTDEIRQSLPA